MKPVVTLVFDIGKTNVKLCAIDLASGAQLDCRKTANDVCYDGSYPHADTDRIWSWLTDNLRGMAAELEIRSIGITTHGATVACLAGDELALPVLDYEYPGIDRLAQDYDACRPGYAETLSPRLPAGLNLGAQLYWLSRQYPEAFSRVTQLLTYPQYWGWRLTGKAASEVTSLGCHTDLWEPERQRFSRLVEEQGWRPLFPPLLDSGAALGSLRPELAAALGLSADCRVFNGIHDSNASLVPHLRHHQQPFAVVSSGTWTVIAGVGSPVSVLDETADMLANVNVFSAPVPSIRFMGGREWETLRGERQCRWEDLVSVVQMGVYALPCFVDQGGPFQRYKGRFTGPVQRLSGAQKTALATLYVALMTDYCLSRLEQRGDIIIEGAFASNDLFLTSLASLRPDQAIIRSSDRTGTTLGTAMLSHPEQPWSICYQHIEVSEGERLMLRRYREGWLEQCPVITHPYRESTIP